MRYFKNSELTRLYKVSDKAVRNWIDAARHGKIELELLSVGERVYVADSLANEILLEKLVDKGKKFRNKRNHRELSPHPLFYDIYNPGQIMDIINNLEIRREIPLHYYYLGKGALYWDAYLQKLNTSARSNYLTTTVKLLELEKAYRDSWLNNLKAINVVDIGVGNGLVIKKLLSELHASGRLNRYIGIDISEKLLDITEYNLQNWISKDLRIEKYLKDITYDRFTEILACNKFNEDAASTANLVLFLGGAISNFRDPEQALKTLRDSMGKRDLLVSSLKIDNRRSRSFFDFNIDSDKAILPAHERYLLDLLSIEESMYEVEQFFDKKQKSRFIQIRLRVSLSLHFEVNNAHVMIELQRGDVIILVRIKHFTCEEVVELYRQNGFSILQTTKSHDQEYILLTAKVSNIDDMP